MKHGGKQILWMIVALVTVILLSQLVVPTAPTGPALGTPAYAGRDDDDRDRREDDVDADDRGRRADFPGAVVSPFKRAPRPIIGALREPLEKLPQIENFKVLAYNPLPNPGDTRPRGRNGPTGIAGECFYVGNRIGRRTGTGQPFGTPALDPEVLIVSIANPRNPVVVGAFKTIRGATTRELRTIPQMNTLIIMNFRAQVEGEPSVEGPALNNFQIYDIADCRNPRLVQTFAPVPSGRARPHEMFIWRDPQLPARVLLYASISGGVEAEEEPSLRVFELMSPPNGPVRQVATFTLSPAVPNPEPVGPERYRSDHFVFDPPPPTSQGNNLHSMSVSDEGKRVYMSNSQAGYFILNSENLAMNRSCIADTVTVDESSNTNPALCLRLVNPNPHLRIDRSPPYAGISHSIYPVPGRPSKEHGNPRYIITGGERNGTTTCPWTWGEILDASDEMNVQVAARYMVPENLEENCFVGGPGDPALMREFSTHQPLVFPNIFFITWYSAGVRAWDISIAQLPMEVGVFVPRPAANVVERFRESPDVWTWPHPFLHNGLFYIVDENSGLYVLEYKGPRAKELPKEGTFHSNDNLHMFHD